MLDAPAINYSDVASGGMDAEGQPPQVQTAGGEAFVRAVDARYPGATL